LTNVAALRFTIERVETKMTPPRFQFSVRSLFCLLLAIAGVVVFFCSFGAHLLWLPTHLTSMNFASLTEVEFPAVKADESFVRCEFGGITFEMPESMTKQFTARRNAADVWLVFSDATRLLGIQVPPQGEPRPSLLPLTLPVPREMAAWTSPRILKDLCECASEEFSWKQTRKDLRRHQWAISQRKILHFDENNFKYYNFQSDRGCERILISCDPTTVDRKERLRSIMFWETKDRKIGGQLHFGDSVRQDAPWIYRVARSFRVTLAPPTVPRDIASKTDSEILSMIRIEHVPEPWDEDRIEKD
jgi:hypothetical protein